jgi:phosphoribosylanthranilate isomerase
MIIQIYEIQTLQEAEKCIELGVDHLGSVLFSQDKWRVPELKEVIRLSDGTETKNSIIPLFQDRDTLFRSLDYYRPHYVHFCDSLTDNEGREKDLEEFIDFQENLKEKFPQISIIRSIPLPQKGAAPGFSSLAIARKLEHASDILLTDTWLGKEPVKGYIGITGITADWGVARELVRQSHSPVILAGGLSPENVYEAVSKVFPAGADSCTGTNKTDQDGKPVRFKKDFQKVKKFVEGVRRFEKDMELRKEDLTFKLNQLKTELQEREAALPAHSVRPHQLIAIEELEEAIEIKEREINRINKASIN